MTLATEIEFLTHIINLEKRLKDDYVLTLTRTWDGAYAVFVMDTRKCSAGFSEDPCVLQQTSHFAFLAMRNGVQNEVNQFYNRLKANNLLKND